MKKVLFIFVLFMAALVVNAQATKTSVTTVTKSDTLRAVVLVSEIQKTITDNIAKDYAGYTIKEASGVTVNSVLTYEVVIAKDATTETLVYDKNGVFIKKLPPALKGK